MWTFNACTCNVGIPATEGPLWHFPNLIFLKKATTFFRARIPLLLLFWKLGMLSPGKKVTQSHCVSSSLPSSFADTGKSWHCCYLSSIFPAVNLQEVNADRSLDICHDFCCSQLCKHLHLATFAVLLKLRGTVAESTSVRHGSACPHQVVE